MKILFLDIDGVCNSAEYAKSKRNPKKGGLLGIDPLAANRVKKIIEATGCHVVLSSTWRLDTNSRVQVANEVCAFIDVTPYMPRGIRGAEINAWLDKNPQVQRYAILDDDKDMLPDQLPNFFDTTFEHGLTPAITLEVIHHLNKTA